MTSVGFGNVSPETDNEKMFTIIMMIIGGKSLSMQSKSLRTVIERSSNQTGNAMFARYLSTFVCYYFWSCDHYYTADDVSHSQIP